MDKRIFLSYCQKNKNEANIIDNIFLQKGILLTRDVRDLEYKQSIQEFMKKIREHDFAILLISHEYLTSVNCMYEFLQVLKEKDFEKKILPLILIDDFFTNRLIKIEYLDKWEDKIKELENQIDKLWENGKRDYTTDLIEEKKKCEKIKSEIEEIIKYLRDNFIIFFKDEEKNNFSTLLKKIGINNKENVVNNMKPETFFNSKSFEIANSKDYHKTNIGMATANISFKSRDAINRNEKSDKSNSFENGKQKLINGIVDNEVIQYITEILLKKDMLCRFIIKYGDDSIEDISNAILKLNNELQERVMKNIQYSHAEATGYGNWQNYDYFGALSIIIYHGSNNEKIKEIAYNIIENCSCYRSQFYSILKKLDEEKYI